MHLLDPFMVSDIRESGRPAPIWTGIGPYIIGRRTDRLNPVIPLGMHSDIEGTVIYPSTPVNAPRKSPEGQLESEGKAVVPNRFVGLTSAADSTQE